MHQLNFSTFTKTASAKRFKERTKKGWTPIFLILLFCVFARAVSFCRTVVSVYAESDSASEPGKDFDSLDGMTSEDLSVKIDENGESGENANVKTYLLLSAIAAGCAGVFLLIFVSVKKERNKKKQISEMKMNKQIKNAEKFIAKNPVSYADIADMVRHGKCRFIYAQEDGVLLQDDGGFYKHGTFVFAAETEIAARRILLLCPEEYSNIQNGLLACHGEKIAAFCRDFFLFNRITSCYQTVYRPASPLPLPDSLRFEKATERYLPEITQTYDKESPEALKKLVQQGKINCAFIPDAISENEQKEVFVGYIGQHAEGSMGLLYVFPKFRRRGYAKALESFQINAILAEGRTPYAHIIEDNVESIALQHKLCAIFADEKVLWMSRSSSKRD